MIEQKLIELKTFLSNIISKIDYVNTDEVIDYVNTDEFSLDILTKELENYEKISKEKQLDLINKTNSNGYKFSNSIKEFGNIGKIIQTSSHEDDLEYIEENNLSDNTVDQLVLKNIERDSLISDSYDKNLSSEDKNKIMNDLFFINKEINRLIALNDKKYLDEEIEKIKEALDRDLLEEKSI